MRPKTIHSTVGGGFHNQPELALRVKVYEAKGRYFASLSEGQRLKVGRHMCGVESCICGGGYGDVWEAPDDWEEMDNGEWIFTGDAKAEGKE